MVEYKRRQQKSAGKFEFDDTVLQTQTYVHAYALLLRADLTILSKVLQSYRACTERGGMGTSSGGLELRLEETRKDAAQLIDIADKANQPRQVVEGHILFARFTALEMSVGTL